MNDPHRIPRGIHDMHNHPFLTAGRAILLALAVLGPGAMHGAAPVEIPACTAYLDPDPEGAEVSPSSGITRWTNPRLKIEWFGHFKTPGDLECAVAIRAPSGSAPRFRLMAAGRSLEGSAAGAGTNRVVLPLGHLSLTHAGFQRFTLESLAPPGSPLGDVEALVLSGPATNQMHFNLKPRRNAASVHLVYPAPRGTNIAAFYCELTAVEDPVYTYYMACGWHRGYFGMQVNGPRERRLIFSVWDSGKEPTDRAKVQSADRVTLVARGDGVDAGDFGNEGTGGHSHLVYPWRTGERQRFLVTAKPTDATHTIYSGFYFHPERRQWILISSWKAPKDGGWLRGLYSFSENFGGSNGHLLRKVRAGNQWIQTREGDWIELTTAKFSHDPTGKTDRLDRYMGVENGEFFLSHGGFVNGWTRQGERFNRPATGHPPSDLNLPPVPTP